MKKWMTVLGSLLMTLCMGGMYAWSAFVPELQEHYGYTSAQTQRVFGTTFIVFTLLQLYTGQFTDRWHPRTMALFSAVLEATAYLTAGFFGYTFYGLWFGIALTGTATAFGYVPPMSALVKWFPNHKGLMCGFVAGGYGAAAIIMANVANYLQHHGWTPLDIFKYAGVIYGVVIACGAMLLHVPKPGEVVVPEKSDDNSTATEIAVETTAFSRTALVGDARFWRLFLGILFGSIPGMVVVGNLKSIGLWQQVSEQWATWAITGFAIGSASGRVLWGHIYDHMTAAGATRLNLFAIAASVLAVLFGGPISGAVFAVAALIAGFCYGGNFAVYPAQTATTYGVTVMGRAYAMVLVGHGIAGVAGPALIGLVNDATGSPAMGLWIALAAGVAGLLTIIGMDRVIRKNAPTAS